MKATFGGLAAILVSTVALSAAHAQSPPAIPVSSAPVAASAPAGSYSDDGGCASCGHGSKLLGHLGLGGGCQGCGGGGLLHHGSGECGGGLLHHGCGGGLLHKGGCGCGGGLLGNCLGKLTAPYPSDAPTIRKPQPPLGFPAHAYARSPRDFFMMDDP